MAEFLTPSQEECVRELMDIGDFEGAVETVFEFFPTLTRDEAVDLVETVKPKRRKLSRHERLQEKADHEVDTHEEDRGDR